MKEHSFLGIGKHLQEPLRFIYNKVGHNYPTVEKSFILKVSIKAIDDIMTEKLLVNSRSVYEIIPRVPILNTKLPKQGERMDIKKNAQAEMNNIIAERRVLSALTTYIPPAAGHQYIYIYILEEEVLVYSEKEKKWIVPFSFVDCIGRQLTVRSVDDLQRQMFSGFQIKPYYYDIQENLKLLRSRDGSNDMYFVFLTKVINHLKRKK